MVTFITISLLVIAVICACIYHWSTGRILRGLKQDFSVPVVKIDWVGNHTEADALDIVTAEGTVCITKRGEYKAGDLAVLIPLDAVVVTAFEELAFLEPKAKDGLYRVKAARLRGRFSDGIVIKGKLIPKHKIGFNAASIYQIKKYEAPAPKFTTGGRMVSGPKGVPVFGLDNYKKYKSIFAPGEEVVATVKIHGSSFRAGYLKDDPTFYVGSHYSFKEYDPTNVFWKAARHMDFSPPGDRPISLEMIAKERPGLFFYGEVYGSKIQKLTYGARPGEIFLRIFAIWDVEKQKFLDYDQMRYICKEAGVPTVVEVYRGPYIPEKIEPLRSGKDPLADHIREGIVISSTKEVYRAYGRNWMRPSLKLVSEEYLLKDYDTGVH
jgi:RNA ligase (TIGR02306 family)